MKEYMIHDLENSIHQTISRACRVKRINLKICEGNKTQFKPIKQALRCFAPVTKICNIFKDRVTVLNEE